ncbi:MAG: type II toxin-antitoxin system HicB family antitoxin [Bryobacterales bacterium]|nr:type II toxin-antitoxin system HicB family antitoxin [Bryobacterales bacterium]
MNRFLVLFEKSATGYGAYAPDLPGCVATGGTLEETRARMAKAMEMHLASMREEGDPIPEPSHFELVEAV